MDWRILTWLSVNLWHLDLSTTLNQLSFKGQDTLTAVYSRVISFWLWPNHLEQRGFPKRKESKKEKGEKNLSGIVRRNAKGEGWGITSPRKKVSR